MAQDMELGGLVDAIALLSDLSADQNVPRNTRAQLQKMISLLESPSENSVKVHEAINVLDTMSSDINMEPYTRTQLYSLMSMLEKVQ